MNFYLSHDDFERLKSITSNSSNEQAGIMTFKEVENGYSFSGVKVFDKDSDELEASSPRFVKYNPINSLTKIFYEVMLGQDSKGVVVGFHTHPKKLGIDDFAIPSRADEQCIKETQESVDNINKKSGKEFTYVEGIISDSEIGFYYYENGVIKRVNTFIDLVEHIPRETKGAFSSFIDGVKKGMKR